MNRCQRCGIPYHPDSVRCPLCRTLSRSEAKKRSKWFFLTNTLLTTFVATIVLVRVLTSPDAAIGMTQGDCRSVSSLREETAFALESLTTEPDIARERLLAISESWHGLAEGYVPGKFSWSTAGPEHGWLERVAEVSMAIATATSVEVEGEFASPEEYLVELLRLEYRFCSK